MAAGLEKPPTVLFEEAARQHRRGALSEAEAIYADCLLLAPDHVDTLHLLGVLNLQKGNVSEAFRFLSAALAIQPKHASALAFLGLVHELLGRLDEALVLHDRSLAVDPANAATLTYRGNVLKRLERLDEALASYDAALALRPDSTDAFDNRCLVLRRLGRLGEILDNADRALVRDPRFAAAHKHRAHALVALERLDEALATFSAVVALRPKDAEALNDRGNVFAALGRYDDALCDYGAAVAIKPDFALALANAANVLSESRRPAEALSMCDRALAVMPSLALARFNRGNALRDLGRLTEALASYEAVLALEPANVDAYNNRGSVLHDLRRLDEALASYAAGLALNADFATLHANQANVLMELGRFDEAGRAITRAIDLAPRRANYYFVLAEMKRMAADDPHLAAMEALAMEVETLPHGEQVDLHFALSKALSDIGEPDRSFRHLIQANALKRAGAVYDEAAVGLTLDRTRATFSKAMIRVKQGLGDPSRLPVFIVGMPRSGSTLIEQVLASHPDVHGAGEIDDFNVALMETLGGDGDNVASQEALADMPDAVWRRVGARYIERLAMAVPSARGIIGQGVVGQGISETRVVNKRLDNFWRVGFIHLALPEARIIHARRDPLDTCVSCFSKQFAESLPYTYDLAELGRFYRAYEAMMAHWRDVLPEGVVLDVQYEDVVADLEGQGRRIIAACGLAWDARCLDFHRTDRPVRTASATQVRQPLFASSVGRWRAHERFLAPLVASLGTERLAAGPLERL